MIDYTAVMKQLQKLKPLPQGYRMFAEKTENLLVMGPTLGFAITKESIEDYRHLYEYPPALEALVELEDQAMSAHIGNIMRKHGT